ncbi:hypothetical protein ACIPF8_16675 [Collimonas sp. NPDC087041]|uniref:hypothetical protein n=1 Tax=Collimonas sp. NPDC087041 TaxID=3363960 RepID=UPI0037FAE656
MKKLLGIAALLLAFTPFVHAQNMDNPLANHPEARNDRTPESYDRHRAPEHKRHVKKHRRHVEEKK